MPNVQHRHAEHMKKKVADMTAMVGGSGGTTRPKMLYNPATDQGKTIRIGLIYKRYDQRHHVRLLMYLMRIFNGPLSISRD